jgi:eukaryotic-like serine/threonine-protein kinase
VEERVYGSRYRVTEKIGTGGMADVYKAVDEVLGRTVAVKVLHPQYAADPTFVARFRQEAQAAANLSNPHIVNIYDWGQEDSTYYIVMEYVRGTDLKDIIDAKGPLDPAKAAEYGAQVCSALSVAHGYDVIHRDIKPQNIVLTPDGQIKVMDFGIARAGNTTMTQTGSVLGTAQYISPEQAQGRPIGPASDLYSLGIVLYELTTGRLPFTAETPVAVALKQVNEQPVAPRNINPAIPPALETVILTAMAKDPADRYGSADEMREDLRRVVAGQPVLADAAGAMERTSVLPVVGRTSREDRVATQREQPRRRGTGWAWVLAILALVLIGGLVAWAMLLQPKTVPVPNVTNLPIAEATSTIVKAGLAVGSVTTQFSDTIATGTVMSQSPPAGTQLTKGQTVNLVVSGGVQLLEVPDLTGKTQNDAITAIQGAGFTIGSVTQAFSGKVAAGNVISQDPAATTKVPAQTPINIVVSQGVKQATVPDVTGISQGTATSRLENAGFRVKVTKQFSTDVPSGDVISENPNGGSQATAGSTVTIVVSKGLQSVTVPSDVIGETVSNARNELVALGFAVNAQPTSSASTTMAADSQRVQSTDPPVGSAAAKGSTVTIFYTAP